MMYRWIILLFLIVPFSLSLYNCTSKPAEPKEESSVVKEEMSKETRTEANLSISPSAKQDATPAMVPVGVNTAPIQVQSTITPLPQNLKPSSTTHEIPTSETPATSLALDKEETELISSDTVKEKIKVNPYEKIRTGMSFKEVIALIGDPDMLITQNRDGNMKVYRWERSGEVLYGRFENDTLTRSSVKGLNNIDGELTREIYEQIREGMTLEEVTALIGTPGKLISTSADTQTVYLWSDRNGTSFSARFEKGKLTRKSGFYVKPKEMEPESAEKVLPEGSPEQEENLEVEISGEVSGEGEGIEKTPNLETDQNIRTTPSQSINESVPDTTQIPRPERKNNIVYARTKKAVEANKYSSEKPKISRAKQNLPKYTYQLKEGAYEIRIYNPMDEPVKVGIRSGKRGKNVTIPPRGEKSVKVPRGNYQLYYLRGEESNEVQPGGNINIDGLFIGDVEIFLLR